MKLTKHQKRYLRKMIVLQDYPRKHPLYYNNGIRSIIKKVLEIGEYDDEERQLINEMNKRYNQYGLENRN